MPTTLTKAIDAKLVFYTQQLEVAPKFMLTMNITPEVQLNLAKFYPSSKLISFKNPKEITDAAMHTSFVDVVVANVSKLHAQELKDFFELSRTLLKTQGVIILSVLEHEPISHAVGSTLAITEKLDDIDVIELLDSIPHLKFYAYHKKIFRDGEPDHYCYFIFAIYAHSIAPIKKIFHKGFFEEDTNGISQKDLIERATDDSTVVEREDDEENDENETELELESFESQDTDHAELTESDKNHETDQEKTESTELIENEAEHALESPEPVEDEHESKEFSERDDKEPEVDVEKIEVDETDNEVDEESDETENAETPDKDEQETTNEVENEFDDNDEISSEEPADNHTESKEFEATESTDSADHHPAIQVTAQLKKIMHSLAHNQKKMLSHENQLNINSKKATQLIESSQNKDLSQIKKTLNDVQQYFNLHQKLLQTYSDLRQQHQAALKDLMKEEPSVLEHHPQLAEDFYAAIIQHNKLIQYHSQVIQSHTEALKNNLGLKLTVD
jgi:hypothetical protein